MYLVVLIVLCILVFMLLKHHATMVVHMEEQRQSDLPNIMLCKDTKNLEYPEDKKAEDAIVVNNNAETSAASGTVTYGIDTNIEDVLIPTEDTHPVKEDLVVKKRKPRKKLISCENCANFVPIKKTRKKKKEE